jgi:chemosensory pili system protein ChpA (sensor histidine kinase/response regulator)
LPAGLLDEMTRRAQEKLLVFQVGQEVQVNLQNIEAALDAFFRDSAKRPDLAKLPAQFTQVQGALMIMELADAANLNAAVMAKVRISPTAASRAPGEAAEMVADGLSALGLYITALQQGSTASREVLRPALLRFGLIEPAAGRASSRKPSGRAPSRRPTSDVQKQKVQALYEDWKEAPVEERARSSRKAVDELKRDATVMGDTNVAMHSDARSRRSWERTCPGRRASSRPCRSSCPTRRRSAAPQVVQLVDAPGAEIDQELLEIFLEEASEVVGTIARTSHRCERRARPRGPHHHSQGIPHAQGQRPHGRAHGAWRNGLAVRAGHEQVAQGREARERVAPGVHRPGEGRLRALGRRAEGEGRSACRRRRITRQAELLKNGQEVTPPQAVRNPSSRRPRQSPSGKPPRRNPSPKRRHPSPVAEVPASEPVAEPEALSFELEAATPEASGPIAEETPTPRLHSNSSRWNLTPAAEAVPVPEAPSVETAPVEEIEEQVVIGSVSLPKALFDIYLGEAEQHVEAMQREMAALEAIRTRASRPTSCGPRTRSRARREPRVRGARGSRLFAGEVADRRRWSRRRRSTRVACPSRERPWMRSRDGAVDSGKCAALPARGRDRGAARAARLPASRARSTSCTARARTRACRDRAGAGRFGRSPWR